MLLNLFDFSISLGFRFLLPPANVVCEGYVFTGVCLSTGGSGSPSWGGVLHPGGVFSIQGGCSPSRGGLLPGGFSIRGGSPSRGVLHLGGLHPGGGSPSRGGFSIRGSPSGGVLHPGGVLHLGGFSIWGGSPSGQCAGGTHPTGMHSWLDNVNWCLHFIQKSLMQSLCSSIYSFTQFDDFDK